MTDPEFVGTSTFPAQHDIQDQTGDRNESAGQRLVDVVAKLNNVSLYLPTTSPAYHGYGWTYDNPSGAMVFTDLAKQSELDTHAALSGKGGHVPSGGLPVTDLSFDDATQLEMDTLSALLIPDVQVFVGAGSYTWTKPTGAKVVQADVIGPGSGGGSGRRGAAATVRDGGGGGAGGGRSSQLFPASVLGTTEPVTVGAFGTGAAAVTANDTNGNQGGTATGSRFGGTGTTAAAVGTTGIVGGGGGTTGAVGAAPGAGGHQLGGNGAAIPAGTVGGPGAGAAGSPGGGGGGGITAADAISAGGAGAASYSRSVTAPVGGTTPGGAGAAGADAPANSPLPGTSGGGGASSITGAAGAGGAGGRYGAGGGGGGASLNGNNSGAGGPGGVGIVIVTTWRSA